MEGISLGSSQRFGNPDRHDTTEVTRLHSVVEFDDHLNDLIMSFFRLCEAIDSYCCVLTKTWALRVHEPAMQQGMIAWQKTLLHGRGTGVPVMPTLKVPTPIAGESVRKGQRRSNCALGRCYARPPFCASRARAAAVRRLTPNSLATSATVSPSPTASAAACTSCGAMSSRARTSTSLAGTR